MAHARAGSMDDLVHVYPHETTGLEKFLDVVERVGNRVPHPFDDVQELLESCLLVRVHMNQIVHRTDARMSHDTYPFRVEQLKAARVTWNTNTKLRLDQEASPRRTAPRRRQAVTRSGFSSASRNVASSSLVREV